MIFLNVRKLEKQFIDNTITEKEIFMYFFIFCLWCSLGTILYERSISGSTGAYSSITNILFAVMPLIYLYIGYRINKRGDNNDYVTRFVCLGFPLVIRTILLSIPIFVIMGILIPHLRLNIEEDILMLIAEQAMMLMFSLFLFASIKRVSHHKA